MASSKEWYDFEEVVTPEFKKKLKKMVTTGGFVTFEKQLYDVLSSSGRVLGKDVEFGDARALVEDNYGAEMRESVKERTRYKPKAVTSKHVWMAIIDVYTQEEIAKHDGHDLDTEQQPIFCNTCKKPLSDVQ